MKHLIIAMLCCASVVVAFCNVGYAFLCVLIGDAVDFCSLLMFSYFLFNACGYFYGELSEYDIYG